MFRESEPSMSYGLNHVGSGRGPSAAKVVWVDVGFWGGGLEIPKTSLHMIWGGDRLEECFGPGDRLDVSILSILSRMEKSHTVSFSSINLLKSHVTSQSSGCFLGVQQCRE